MDRAALLTRYQGTTNWNEDTLLELALEYIDNQQDDNTFLDFLDHAADSEQAMAAEEEPGMRYNHAYTIAFEVETEHDADDVTADELRAGLRKRLDSLENDQEWLAAADSPYDTIEVGEGRTRTLL